jgi:hypothetical protein
MVRFTGAEPVAFAAAAGCDSLRAFAHLARCACAISRREACDIIRVGCFVVPNVAGEIARVYLFLMQEGYSTGQTVVVDGGAMLMQAGRQDTGNSSVAGSEQATETPRVAEGQPEEFETSMNGL